MHNVAVTDVTPHKTVVCQGYDCHINMTIENQGINNETFNIVAYVNTIIIHTENVINLPARAYFHIASKTEKVAGESLHLFLIQFVKVRRIKNRAALASVRPAATNASVGFLV